MVGDQLTCKSISGARKWREAGHATKGCLTSANEVPGNKNYDDVCHLLLSLASITFV